MIEFNVYIVNLRKYNEGELKGAWFTPPLNINAVYKKIGIDEEYKNYVIHDYESPIHIPEYTSIEQINKIYNQLRKVPKNLENCITEMMNEWFSSLDELIENIDNIIVYPNCHNMRDVAIELTREEEFRGYIPPIVFNKIDFDAYAKKLAKEQNFISSKAGMIWLAS